VFEAEKLMFHLQNRVRAEVDPPLPQLDLAFCTDLMNLTRTGGASSLLSQRLDYHIIPAEELIVEHREEVIRNIKNKKKLKEQDYKPPPDPLFDAEGLGNNITLVTEDTAQFVQGAWGRGVLVRIGTTPWEQPAAGPYLASNLGTPSSAQEAPDLSNEDEFPAL
ncbi:unnamed protein product, partial [Cyprideis torosa]